MKYNVYGASLMVQTVKNLPKMQETWVQSLGQEDPLEKGLATHFSILGEFWRITRTEERGYSSWGCRVARLSEAPWEVP